MENKMNNDLSFWRKLLLDIGGRPKTDADIAYLYRDLVRPEIPASALWDAERGANERANNIIYAKYEMGPSDFREKAILNRGWGINQTAQDMPEKTPTGRIMRQLLEERPDYIVVPERNEMSNFWQN